MNDLKEALKKSNGVDAVFSICHALYGTQKIKHKLDYIFDDERIGFKIKDGNEIFIYRKDLVDYGTKDGIYFADDVMCIKIRKCN